MLPNIFRHFSIFLRENKSIFQHHVSNYFHGRTTKALHKYLNSSWKSNKRIKSYKTISLTAATGFGAYACAVISKKSDPFFQEEIEGEFDELFLRQTAKEDFELLKSFGPVPFLLIGSGPAAVAASRAIRLQDPTAKILIISEEQFYPYRHAPLSNELWYLKELDPAKKKKHVFYDKYYISVQQMLENKNGGLAIIRGKKVLKIDPVSQVVVLDSGEQIIYDKCLLATGTKPKNLPVFQESGENIKKHLTLFHSIQDFINLEKISRKAKSIAVIGGGVLGSELASGLNEYNKSTNLNVIQIFPESRHLSNVLPEYLSKWIETKFQNKDIHIMSGVCVKAVTKNQDKIELHLSNNEIVSVDHVVVAVGAEPNTEIALLSGLETDSNLGGFLVNAEMRARKNLWIAGKVSSFYDARLGRCRIEHPEDAAQSGHLAGENMTGSGKPFHFETDWWSVLASDIFFEAIGDIDAKLETVGVFVKQSSNDSLKSVTDTNDSPKFEKQNTATTFKDDKLLKPTDLSDIYNKGVLFYLKDNRIVGILLWNIVGDTEIARKVIRDSRSHEEAIEISKLFINPTFLNNANDEMNSNN